MVTFGWPWFLLGAAAVAAVAVLALRCPGILPVRVPSLRLWREVIAAYQPSPGGKRRRISASWLSLAAGALCGAVAFAQPVFHGNSAVRRVAIVLTPSAELRGDGGRSLRQSTERLLARFADDDQVQLILPHVLGGASRWMSVAVARGTVANIVPAPVAGLELPTGPAPADVQHVYYLTPTAGANAPDGGERASIIQLPTRTSPVTIEAIGAVELPDGACQVFAAIRNHTGKTLAASLQAEAVAGGPDTSAQPVTGNVSVPPFGRAEWIGRLPAADAIAVELFFSEGSGGKTTVGGGAYLVRTEAHVARVAIIGRDDPHLRRYVNIDTALSLVGSARQADIVIANGVDPPPPKAAMVIDPPRAPRPWRRGDELQAVSLAGVDVKADDPVMRDVDLAGVAVRRVRPWIADGAARRQSLASLPSGAIILGSGGGPGDRPRRIYVAFDLSPDNTNFAMTEAFVIFMAAAMRHLAPQASGTGSYEYLTPLAAGAPGGWEKLLPTGEVAASGSPFLSPGVYRSVDDTLMAVTLVGLPGPTEGLPVNVAIDSAPLPAPQYAAAGRDLWPMLAIAAMVLWLVGWTLRYPRRIRSREDDTPATEV